MQFTPDRAQQIIDGIKTQTRRPDRVDERIATDENNRILKVWSGAGVKRYAVGQIYAVQPGRGKLGIAHIKLLEIWREDVRTISHDDAIAEGFTDRSEFWKAWMTMYDKVGRRAIKRGDWRYATLMGQVPTTLCTAWALKFELVK